MINSFSDTRFDSFKNDVNSVWVKKLIREFDKQNYLVYEATKCHLEYPNFEINYDKNFWGTWNKSTKTITLSCNLFENFEWDAVVQTLKHEMAHMIVSEIWKDISNNGNDHGELFKKACGVMNVSDQRSHSSFDKAGYRLPEKEKIVSKIHKLFSLGESNHKAEAELAVQKAHELMIKYNVESLNLLESQKLFVSRPVGNINAKIPTYIKSLASVVCDNYFVKHIYIPYNGMRYIEMYGEPHNVDIAEYVFHFLIIEGERQWEEFKKSDEYINRHSSGQYTYKFDYETGEDIKRKKSTYSKMAFLEGFVSGFSKTLSQQQEKVIQNISAENKMPVTIDDPLLDEKYQKEYNPKSWNTYSRRSGGGGFEHGSKRGSSVTIRQGVSRGSSYSGRGIKLIA